MRAGQTGQGPVVAVLGHYGNRNLGDEAIVAAMIAGLRRRAPGVEAVAVSLDPAESARRHGVRSFPLRRTARSDAVEDPAMPPPAPRMSAEPPAQPDVPARPGLLRRLARPLRRIARVGLDALAELRFMLRVAGFLRRTDLLAVTGSNQFLDNFGGASAFPWTLFKWSLLARLTGTRLAVVAVGAGPLEGRTSRFLVRRVLGLARHVSFRDAASRTLASGAGRSRGTVCPDLAFSLPLNVPEHRGRIERVGINPMPVFDGRYWPIADAERYRAFVTAMAGLVARLREHGFVPFLFPTQPSDLRVIDDLQDLLRESGGVPAEVQRPETVDELVATIGSADLVVPTRFHGTVLALACGRPVVPVCYHRKTGDVAAAFGLGDLAFPIEDLDPDAVLERVLTLDLPSTLSRIDQVRQQFRNDLETEYERLLGPLTRSTGALREPEVSQP